MSEQKEYVADSSSTTASSKRKMLKWEYLARIDRGPLQPSEKLNRARFGNGWLVKYEFAGGSHKSGCSLVYVSDPQGLWLREEKVRSKVINSQRHPSTYLIIRQFEAHPGSFLTVAAGTRQMFWTQLLFVPAIVEEKQDIAPGD